MLAFWLSCRIEYTTPVLASNSMAERIAPCLLFITSSSGSDINMLPSLGSMLKRQSRVPWSLQPLYSVSPSNSISPKYLLRYMLHPASTSSGPESRLWGSSSTVNPVLALSGSLFILNLIVSVVFTGTAAGVSSSLFFSCIIALSAAAPFARHVTDAAVSKKAHVLFGLGGGAQPNVLSSLSWQML